MTAYLFVLARAASPDGWDRYRTEVADCVAAHGGRYLVKRSSAEALEGDFQYQRLTCFAFDDMQALHAFWHSDEYQKRIKPLREGLGEFDVWAAPGIDESEREDRI
ncbi:DUF1330 domain-containing protein [Notoacmeibacter sp. MSK16QG-6]|uniref:DUF1330 domain-containing protein n=1 Tax=Notoacmeibacter sp. MSK16QG-6 TaxID=2957982 RepID=UPI0020A0299B|nr:DUF1330 domain-containing protein [Notoacmeibacter sp. MSK16QG-6]MCP1198346.1 DUF1330 domain-containing protein [Notoacmeibacter sp. MSK16QG-6]